MDKNFRVRSIVAFGMFAVSLAAFYTFNAIPFKIIFGLFSLISMIELFSFFKRKKTAGLVLLTLLELIFLACGIFFVAKINSLHFWYLVLGVPGYDIFAYLFGKLIGGKIFKKSRPFPYISKNKTWEGTFFGLLMSVSMVSILMAVRGTFDTDFMYLLCGPLALTGDLFESFLKRCFGIKDSNEILIKNPIFKKLEILVGGSEGHGGFLDRVDSTAFSATVLLIVSFVI